MQSNVPLESVGGAVSLPRSEKVVGSKSMAEMRSHPPRRACDSDERPCGISSVR
jgi:hypothetical protein